MTAAKLKKLHTGDEVFWIDPDDGRTSKSLIVQSVKICGEIIQITDKNGDYLECFAHELKQK